VTRLEQRYDARDVRGEVRFAERPAGDEADHHDSRFGVREFRREPGRICGDGGRALTIAEDVMGRNVVAAPHDEALATVIDDEGDVRQTSAQRLDRHLRSPGWQLRNARLERGLRSGFGRWWQWRRPRV
jgi:hypothetical protein